MNVPILRRHWASAALIYSKAFITMSVGLLMVFGSDEAFASRSWMRAFSLFSRQWWGATMVVVSAALIAAMVLRRDRDFVIYMLYAEAALYAFFALTFLSTAIHERGLGVIGALTWSEIAIAHVLISVRVAAPDQQRIR